MSSRHHENKKQIALTQQYLIYSFNQITRLRPKLITDFCIPFPHLTVKKSYLLSEF